jgi:hypothetical protein
VSKAYLNSSIASVLPSANNGFLARLAVLVTKKHDFGVFFLHGIVTYEWPPGPGGLKIAKCPQTHAQSGPPTSPAGIFEKSPASLCGAEEQNARAIGTYAQCDCSNYLEIESVSKTLFCLPYGRGAMLSPFFFVFQKHYKIS